MTGKRRKSMTGKRRKSMTGKRRKSMTGKRRKSVTGKRRKSVTGKRRKSARTRRPVRAGLWINGCDFRATPTPSNSAGSGLADPSVLHLLKGELSRAISEPQEAVNDSLPLADSSTPLIFVKTKIKCYRRPINKRKKNNSTFTMSLD